MAFTEDLSVFFDDDDFATSVSIMQVDGAGTLSVSGIWDDAYNEAPLGLAGMATSGPRLTCAAADVRGVDVDDVLTKDGTQYRISELQPDGTGVMVLTLKLLNP